MSKGNVLLGVLAGAAIGALVGVLYAPEKGSETRRKIAKKKDELIDGITNKFNNIIETVTESFDEVKEEAAGFKNKYEGGLKNDGGMKSQTKSNVGMSNV